MFRVFKWAIRYSVVFTLAPNQTSHSHSLFACNILHHPTFERLRTPSSTHLWFLLIVYFLCFCNICVLFNCIHNLMEYQVFLLNMSWYDVPYTIQSFSFFDQSFFFIYIHSCRATVFFFYFIARSHLFTFASNRCMQSSVQQMHLP